MFLQLKSKREKKKKISKILSQHNLLAVFLEDVYLSGHLRLITDLMATDRGLFSDFSLLLLATMLSQNLYTVSVLMQRTVPLKEAAQLVLIVVMPAIFTLTACLPASAIVRVIYSAQKYFYAVQPFVGFSKLYLKLKVATYYEVLTSGEKFAFSCGPVGKITSNSLFQVFFCF